MTDRAQRRDIPTKDVTGESWTPGTDELQGALPALIARMRTEGVLVRRVMYNPADWTSPTPRRIQIAGEVIKLGAFNYQQRDTITLVADGGRSRTTVQRAPR